MWSYTRNSPPIRRRKATRLNLTVPGVHAAYVAIDAVIDVPWTRKMAPDKPYDFFCQSADIAEEVYRIAHQPSTAWSFDSVIRPFAEN